MPRDYDWLVFIDKRAALKEQFPPLRQVVKERPGTAADKAAKEFFHVDNRRSVTEARRRQATQEADADRFIREMRAREQERFLARVAARQLERKTA
jgi:hypothetical protein